jgi:hypothetical protein
MVVGCAELWFNAGMNKQHAIELLGGSVAAAARNIGITFQAVDKWPDELPPRIADRVQAALYRMSQSSTPQTRGTSAKEVTPAKAEG